MRRIDMRGRPLGDPHLEAHLVRMPRVEMHFHFEDAFRLEHDPRVAPTRQGVARTRALVGAGENDGELQRMLHQTMQTTSDHCQSCIEYCKVL